MLHLLCRLLLRLRRAVLRLGSLCTLLRLLLSALRWLLCLLLLRRRLGCALLLWGALYTLRRLCLRLLLWSLRVLRLLLRLGCALLPPWLLRALLCWLNTLLRSPLLFSLFLVVLGVSRHDQSRKQAKCCGAGSIRESHLINSYRTPCTGT